MKPLQILLPLSLALLLSGAGAPGDNQQIAAPALQQDHSANRVNAMGRAMRNGMVLAMERFPWQRKKGDKDPPLFGNLGNYSLAITTTSKEAQLYFDQGLIWAYGFNHAEAVRAFRKAQDLDPQCGMCYWGEAYALGPNINMPMSVDAVAPAVAAARKAEARSGNASPFEQALIAAMAKRYSDAPQADRQALDRDFADAMAEVAARFPQQQDAAVIFAESVMDLSPWDYWEADGTTAKGKAQQAIDAIEGVIAVNPNHSGAIHLYIHLLEASKTPERAEAAADRLRGLVPGAGHLEHMPSHIYLRVGRHLDSIAVNATAAAADEAYLQRVKAQGIYPYGYYPHNVHFLMQSALFAGDGKTALKASEKLIGILSSEFARTTPWVEAILPTAYFAHAQFSDAATILTLPDPGDDSALRKAMWHYARGLAFAWQRDVANAQAEAAAIAAIKDAGALDSLVKQNVPGPALADIARHSVLGRLAQVNGDLDAAAQHFAQAVAIHDTLPYMEPPYWYYPVQQSLGAVLLAQGKPAEAARWFEKSLELFDNNAWSLWGLMTAQEMMSDTSAAHATKRRFEAAWAGGKTLPDLTRL